MGQIHSLAEALSLLRRRKRLILAVFLPGTLAALAFALTQPRSYEATAVIQIEQPIIATSSAAPGAATAMQLQPIQQRLTTREAMLALIARHDLFADQPALPDGQRVALLRQAITFQTIPNTTPGAAIPISALSVTARLGAAEQAARVANDLAQAVLDRATEEQALRADDTLSFYTEEETRLWNEIVALDVEFAAFKNRNAAALPAPQTALQAELTGVEADLRALNQSQLALITQRDNLAAQTDLRTTGQRQLETLSMQIAALLPQKQALETRRAVVQAAMARGPQVQQAISAYDRRLTQLQDQHAVVSRQLAQAQTAQRLADRQQAERFSMLERATTPESPASTNRLKLAAIGAISGLLLALATAFALDLRRPVVRTAAQMKRQAGLVPLVVLPDLGSPKARI